MGDVYSKWEAVLHRECLLGVVVINKVCGWFRSWDWGWEITLVLIGVWGMAVNTI